jgi:hypothetical protein
MDNPPLVVNFVSVRTGDKYGPEYVAILHDMLARNCSQLPQKHWCVTDDPASLPDHVTPIAASNLPGWWEKVRLFSAQMPWAKGERIAFFDLDCAVTGRLEDLVQTPGILRDWHTGALGSAVMVWDHGEHRRIWTEFDLTTAQGFGGDQDWMTHIDPDWTIWPSEWCVSYKTHAKAWPPQGAKVVCMHGKPKPHECGGWVANVWKIGGFTSLPKMGGMNVSHEQVWANVAQNLKRDLPWFTGAQAHDATMALVCGGPSLKDSALAIKDRKRRGARIVTVNNALRYLSDLGLRPDAHVMLDARAENAAFVKDAPEGVQYFIASQCHPDVFDTLASRQVSMWHNAIGEGERLAELAGPHETPDKPLIQIPGGGTVGLRAMWLAFFSGYRKLHIYGMDGSYEEGRHHAYAQPLNDGEATLEVVMGGRRYTCAKWMARQADEFQWIWAELTRRGMDIRVHGRGLIPDMAKTLRLQEAA